MEIFVYRGFAELPTIDFDCLRILAYIKIHQIPISINLTGNAGLSPSGFLPYLKTDDKHVIAGYETIIEHFNELGYGSVRVDSYLSASYIQYLHDNLYPCFQYTLWGDPANGDATRMLYAQRTPFPFNFTHPAKYTKRTEDLVATFGNFSIKDKLENHKSAELLIKAKVCINVMSTRLGEKSWILGDSPSEVDSTLYAYLAILQHIVLQNNPLKAHIIECPNLVKYTIQIRTKYLTGIDDASGRIEKSTFKSISSWFVNTEDGSISKTTMKICAGLVAVGAMVLFAVTHGIVELTFDDNDDGSYLAQMDDESDYGNE